MIYLDSAALVKLCHDESSTAELVNWLNERHGQALVTSALAEVEVPRALARYAPDAVASAPAQLARTYRIEIDQTVRATAAAFPEPDLRSLDAIHLATAQIVRDPSDELTFVTYDRRLLAAAQAQGLVTASPGQQR